MLNEFPTQYGQSSCRLVPKRAAGFPNVPKGSIRFLQSNAHHASALLLLFRFWPRRRRAPICTSPAITAAMSANTRRSTQRIRDRHERVIIDGICNSACTLVFGIVPLNKICVTPRASLGFHQAYYDKAFTFGIKVTSAEGTADLMSYYPDTVKDWIRRNGGLTTEMKKIKNGDDLWKIVDPCPEEFF